MNPEQNHIQNEKNDPVDRLTLLIQRAMQGDRDVLPALRECLDAHPELWQDAGNLALQAQRAWISMAVGADLLREHSIRRQLDAMRTELLGPTPSPLERLLVDQVLQAWLQSNHSVVIVAQNSGLSEFKKAFLQRRQDQAQKQYLAALKALATMQKLLPKGRSKQKKRAGLG